MGKDRRSTGCILGVTGVIGLFLCGVMLFALAWLFLRGADWTWSTSSSEGGTRTSPEGISVGGAAVPMAGTLRLVGGEPVTLDPALVEDAVSSSYVNKIFAGLVGLDAHLEIQPALAEKWEVDESGAVYTFFLRENARFQDGRQVTAEDVKYSLERACDPETGSTVAGLYLGDIVGAAERLAGLAEDVKGVEVLDERTIRITIDAPKAYFLAKMTYPTAAVVDREQIARGADWTGRPNGTGAYRLEEYSDDAITLEANEWYFGGEPRIQRLVFDLSAGDPTTMYENNELDVAPVGLEDIERVLDPYNPLSDELIVIPQLTVQYIGLNTRIPPFDDVQVRQAFVYATDRELLSKVTFKQAVLPAWGVLPPGLPGYNQDVPHMAFDPERARALLAGSSYGGAKGLPPIVLGTSVGSSAAARALARMFEDNLGVKVEIHQTAWSDYLRDINQGVYSMFSLGWTADYPDPQNFLDIHFHSESAGNSTGYANPEVDALLEEARVEPDEEKRMALYQQAEAVIIQDAPWIPLFHDVEYVLVKPYVKGLVITPQGDYDVSNAYLLGQ